jgi:hypothetical protein
MAAEVINLSRTITITGDGEDEFWNPEMPGFHQGKIKKYGHPNSIILRIRNALA